jgi:hypothetical protein
MVPIEEDGSDREQQWTRLGLLIFVNNLGAVAFVGRTLYGIALVPAVYLAYRQGLSHGTFAAQSSMRPSGSLMRLAILEFGAYLRATALGVNLGITPLAGGTIREAITQLVVFYPVVAFALALGAWLEVKELRSRRPTGLQLPKDLNIEELRAKALELMKRRPGGAAQQVMERTRGGLRTRGSFAGVRPTHFRGAGDHHARP